MRQKLAEFRRSVTHPLLSKDAEHGAIAERARDLELRSATATSRSRFLSTPSSLWHPIIGRVAALGPLEARTNVCFGLKADVAWLGDLLDPRALPLYKCDR